MLMNAKTLVDKSLQSIKIDNKFNKSQNPVAPNLSEKIFSIIASSYAINKHIDFYNWLQTSVAEVLPHNVLLACWGDFESNSQKFNFNYDVASNLANIRTQALFDSPQKADDLMRQLHKSWSANNNRWLTVNNLDSFDVNKEIKSKLPEIFNEFKSLLVYGLSDLRASNDCLYVFFSTDTTFEVQDSLMGLLMPHIDNVLRKIQHIEPVDISEAASVSMIKSYNLSTRELEIIDWVKQGKTDGEIAMILYISQNTVKSHLKHVFEKLNVTRRAQAVAKLSYS
ncbi:XrtB/PEP-CTERM-associated transcriptional regulator EpsA [Methylotenera sp.]|uniref:XrtB/PEP-CTERM-associated transcriptional regulator EpsA n=1 Tax=Methylotenera sp. TaxID=2051956 RepID=UPI0024895544|nr:XrtB/PEP-CTERM-associated transcriptional regulator EpsA [Methylotenera sp.]MDI1300039.1 LuxR C-terminal-related transcriptional regulator [Methylotenera sp.]